MDLASTAQVIGIASSIALVISVCLLAYNIRVSRIDARRNLAFSMMEQLTSKEFADRRFRMRQSIANAAAADWAGFDDGLDDLECRAFAYQYELIGQMVRAGILDYPLVRDFLQYTVVADWNAFDPLDEHLGRRYPGHVSPWERFRELALRITTDLQGPAVRDRAPGAPAAMVDRKRA